MDTVIIKIYGPHKFQITSRSWFLPEISTRKFHELSPTEKQSERLFLRRFIFQPPYTDIYLPKIEIFETLNKDRNNVVYVLKSEFSVPKLVYGNSLQEVSGVDFERVLYIFKKSLAGVGILIESDTVANARVSAVHFCKNIPLPANIRIQEILDELMRVDISKVVDITKTEFKKGGRVLHIYSGTIERVFYDKVSDAMRPKIKRKDKGRIARERGIIERHKLENREVFRYEYRIKKAQTVMRDINVALGREPKTYVAFKDLFEPGLCKAIVLKSWRDLIQRPENQLALIGPSDELGLLLHIISETKKQNGKAHSMNNALVSYGLACAIRDHGAKEVRRVIFEGWNTDHSERFTRKMETAAELTKGLPYSNSIAYVDKALEDFHLITLASLEYGI